MILRGLNRFVRTPVLQLLVQGSAPLPTTFRPVSWLHSCLLCSAVP